MNQLRRELNCRLRDIEKMLPVLEEEYRSTLLQTDHNKILKLKYEYNTILNKHVSNILLKLKQKHFELGDKPEKLQASQLRGEQASQATLQVKEKWELEMNVVTGDQEWEQLCENGHKLTSSPTWKEFIWKVNVRYFKTPFIISKFDKTKTNLCWRHCGQIGDHTHFLGLSET